MLASLEIALLVFTATAAPPSLPEPPSAEVPAQDEAEDESPPAKAVKKSELGLRRVAFVQRPSAPRRIPPDLRDPFGPRALDRGTARGSTPSDLRDPFRAQSRPPAGTARDGDLRDPFEKNHSKPPPCPESTTDGVPLQRPAAVKKDRCERAEHHWSSETYVAAR